MFNYKKFIKLNNKFKKSTHIVYDNENCDNYILTTSSYKSLESILKSDYINSLALIGPFGSGKSSFLVYLNALLNDKKNCISKLKMSNKKIYDDYSKFINNKNFLEIKIVGEYVLFKDKLKDSISSFKFLKLSNKYLKENSLYQVSKLLSFIEEDIKDSEYSNVLITIDEFGKFIDYSIEKNIENDLFELQTLAEFVNSKNNFKLIVVLHKSFREYIGIKSNITYSDWDKIQGRFENIIFQDDFYEMLNVFTETITLDDSKYILEAKKEIHTISKDYFSNNKNKKILDTTITKFEKLIPFHPFSVLIVSEIFTKYFHNQRSIYSFLFSSEPYAFQEFINRDLKKIQFLNLANLFDYISYLLKIYNIEIPDKQIWYLSSKHISKDDFSTIEKDILKTISILSSFKVNNLIHIDEKNIVLSLLPNYQENFIKEGIKNLLEKNLILFQSHNSEFSLIEESNINLNKELNNELENLTNLSNANYEKIINEAIKSKFIVAKRFFSKYGNRKYLKKIYIDSNKNSLNDKYKIFYVNKSDMKDILKFSKENKTSIFIYINEIDKLYNFAKNIIALNNILNKFTTLISADTKEIISNMIYDNTTSIEIILENETFNNKLIYNSTEYEYSSKNLQSLTSNIFEKHYRDTPILNNFIFTHSSQNKGVITSILKKLFEGMINNYNLENFGFEKLPPEKALYLSIIKPSSIHKKINNEWILSEPENLNMKNIWSHIKSILKDKKSIDFLLNELKKEPFGLEKDGALFIISLFIIVHNSNISIFREGTYKYIIDVNMIINMWKNPTKYEIKFIKLSSREKKLFKNYLKIVNSFENKEYSKDNIRLVIEALYQKVSNFTIFSKNT